MIGMAEREAAEAENVEKLLDSTLESVDTAEEVKFVSALGGRR